MISSFSRSPSKKLSSSKRESEMQFLKELRYHSSVNISQGDLLGVTTLKRSTKGAMTSSFRNALYTKFSTSKNYYGNVICNGSAQSTFKIHQ